MKCQPNKIAKGEMNGDEKRGTRASQREKRRGREGPKGCERGVIEMREARD